MLLKMKSTNTFGVHFIIRHSRKQNGLSPVYARIVINKTRCELSLKYYVREGDWNAAKGAAKPKNDELKQMKSYLEEIRSKIVHHYREIERNDLELTASSVKDAFLGIVKEDETSKRTLIWLVEEHNTHMQKVLKLGSLKNYYTTLKYLKIFLEKKYKQNDLLLKELRFEFITAFEYFIRNCPIKENDPCTNNGTMKHLERLKKIMNRAARNEWIEKNPFINYQLKYKYKERNFLTETELSILEKTDFINLMLEQVRDLFVFSFYTGLSYIDLVNLEPTQVITHVNGTKWITTSRAKNDISVNVPLLHTAFNIMEKYRSASNMAIRETVFPRISNQEMNRSLKLITGICSIGKYLTFHMSRHTFATTVTLMNGVPIESISKMMGHSKLSTTMIYAKVSQLKIGMDMESLQNKLDGNGDKLKLKSV